MLHRFLPAAVAALVVTATACGPTDSDESTASTTAAVVGGVLSGPEDDGIVEVITDRGSGGIKFCTGILLAPNFLLTARHCVSYGDFENPFTCNADGSLVQLVPGAGVMQDMVRPESITVCTGSDCTKVFRSDAGPAAVGRRVWGLQTDSICQSDIAAVQLDRSLDVPVVPVRLDAATRPRDTVRAVGYGTSDLTTTDIRHSRAGILVLAVAASPLYPEGGGTPPGTFVVGPGPCQGDSGGPTLSEPTDPAQQGAVLGVDSIGSGLCSSDNARSVYTQVAFPAHRNFVVNAAQEAGVTLTPEETGAAGMAGAGGAEGGAGGAEGGGGDVAGSATVGGSPAGRRGLRKKSGCTCIIPSGAGGAFAWPALLSLFAIGLCRRRRLRTAALRG